jgi:Ribbon-helix-helix protein, copG family
MAHAFTDADFHRLAEFDTGELIRLYQFLLGRLRDTSVKETVVSLRLSAETVEHLKVLAARHNSTRSELARRGVTEYVRRNPI